MMSSPHPHPSSGKGLQFTCTQCGQLLQVGAAFAGQLVRCPQCKATLTAPQRGEFPATSPAERLHQPAEGVASGGTAAGQATASAASSQAAQSPDTAPRNQVAPGTLSSALFDPAQRRQATGPLAEVQQLFDAIIQQVQKVFVGQEELVLGTLVALFSGGHVLIESFPGLGKTLFVRTLGRILGCQFSRIQFTADLMPSDITGAPVFDMKTQEFRFRPGPVFTQLLLADEINRSPAKTHAALLEIMQEYRVTVDGTSHVIRRPFLVLATQNPIESEGTYNLPEAQLDRFMFKLIASYPQEEEEARILKLHSRGQNLDQRLEKELEQVTGPEEILRVMELCEQVTVDDRLVDYINRVVRRTRQWPAFYMGASPRAGLALMRGTRTLAAFQGRDYAVPDDVVELVLPTLRHRVILSPEAEVEGRTVDEQLRELLRTVEVPRL